MQYPHNHGESAYLTHEDSNLANFCCASHSFACHQVVSTIKLTFFDEPKKSIYNRMIIKE